MFPCAMEHYRYSSTSVDHEEFPLALCFHVILPLDSWALVSSGVMCVEYNSILHQCGEKAPIRSHRPPKHLLANKKVQHIDTFSSDGCRSAVRQGRATTCRNRNYRDTPDGTSHGMHWHFTLALIINRMLLLLELRPQIVKLVTPINTGI